MREENEELKARLKAKEPEAPANQPQAAGDKPLLKDYDNADDWEEAKYQWRQAKEAEGKRLDAHNGRMAAAGKAHGEKFDEAIDALHGIKIATAAHEALIDSDHSAEILFYLGNNAEEAEKLSRMDAVKQIKAIGRIEATLASATATQTKEPAPKITKGPPKPITPLTGGKAVGTGATDWMDSADYEVFRAGSKRAAAANQ